ncbi:MAG: hypothetical protein UT48_C0016G0031 [Parcubacteria group bacterium GW2011_GWE2_39_37]|uniref:Uncharacterized protein n=1 Tax=Candidatus Falkowbacteria bacterium GW2011_GWF2_39_8 TaxID=1618642 RepID=A0A0G0Q2T4_9BACT|nr:MAG: hypothetical protein UT48_C0016G0031 [Parcubacteria group bacterium GW2011_GWE2_39_37]KKR31666.1 MAG: hypothetical protein UT64_C0054G0009 [Candidatus Falkowbacteria bacterium GW2011_GWF2_39_8]
MDFAVDKTKVNLSGDYVMRQAGYGHINDFKTGHDSYVRRLSREHYPRLHLYLKNETDKLIFSLHLDQKQASYAGSHMHSAEYGGRIVEEEVQRIKSLIVRLVTEQRNKTSETQEEKKPWYKF